MKILHHIIALTLIGVTLYNMFTTDYTFNMLQSTILLLTVCYIVYVYRVFWE